jgi:hypothetical protein
MSVEAADRYVAAGAALLDQKWDGERPWREVLYARRDGLNVGSLTSCPLGILYGLYERGLERLELDPDDIEAATHGFNRVGEYDDDGEIPEDDQASYEELRVAWLDEIEPVVAE